jgi:hypothetical protein
MNQSERLLLISEKRFLEERLGRMPGSARLTRISAESRLREIDLQLAQSAPDSSGGTAGRAVMLRGRFNGYLPARRTFEFTPDGDRKPISGMVAAHIADPEQINFHLNREIQIQLFHTEAGGEAQYLLCALPSWTD